MKFSVYSFEWWGNLQTESSTTWCVTCLSVAVNALFWFVRDIKDLMVEMAAMQSKGHKEGLDLKDPLEQLETQDYQYVKYLLANPFCTGFYQKSWVSDSLAQMELNLKINFRWQAKAVVTILCSSWTVYTYVLFTIVFQ